MISEENAEIISNIIEEICQASAETKNVEDIQNLVELKLMELGYYKLAKTYIEYRYIHKLARDRSTEMMNAITEKLMAKNVQNQNANVDEHSFGGRTGETTSYILKDYALNYCMSKMARENHLNNEVYIHDLDAYAVGMHNCLSIPFDKLLAEGFNTRQMDIRPASSVNTAMQLVAVIFQLQSLQQFGGVSATHIDWTMVPYIRKSFLKHFKKGMKYIERDKTPLKYDKQSVVDVSIDNTYWKQWPNVYEYAIESTKEETHQAVEALYHNLNTLTK